VKLFLLLLNVIIIFIISNDEVPTTILLLSRALMINPSIDPDTIKSSLLTNLSENLVFSLSLLLLIIMMINIINYIIIKIYYYC
jgi:hypothetical protein